MKAELQKKIFDTYPEFFVEKDLPMSETCMCWGLDVGDGWFELLKDLCQDLAEVLIAAKKPLTSLHFTQIKEKYGTLRAYYSTHGLDDDTAAKIEQDINNAEARSETTCEKCGKSGELNNGPWYFVTCADCEAAQK